MVSHCSASEFAILCVFCCTAEISCKSPKAGQHLVYQHLEMISQHDVAILFFNCVIVLPLQPFSICFHLEEIYRHGADNTTFTVDFRWECGNAAVTTEHLVPQHPLSRSGCLCLIWVTARPQHNRPLCLKLPSPAKQLPNRKLKVLNALTSRCFYY